MKKKLVSLMLVAAMTASLTACGSKKTEEPISTVHKSITAAEYDAAITSDAAIYKKAFTMPEYKGIQVTVDKSVLNVAESDVDDYINKNIVSAEATTENVTSGVTADGDTVILDYSGKLDGEAFSGGTATDTTYTIGSGNFISDLDKGLVGLTVGQEYDIPCTFPDNYTSDLAGKSVIFTVKVTAIQKTTYPEITDEWVVNNKESLNLSGDTVADFREEVRKIVEANANDTYLNNTFTSAYQIISENIGDVNYPQDEIDSLVEVLNTNIESEFNTYGSYYGISDLDTYKKSVYGFDSIDAFNEYATSSAQQYLLQKMIVTIIAADNDIHVSEDEINSYGNDLAQYYGYDDFNAIVDAVGSEVVSEIGYEILYQKVVEFECSQITEVEQ
jgi:trigger factor